MLILTRREGNKVIIGNCIAVSVIECDHGRVKLGIDEPEGVSVHRNEIYKKILEEGKIDKPIVNIDDFTPSRKRSYRGGNRNNLTDEINGNK